MSVEVFTDERFIVRLPELVAVRLEITDRKHEFDLSAGQAPAVIADLGNELVEDLGQEPNTAILKRYFKDQPSRAYDWHTEPKRFTGRVAVHSLNNMTLLYTCFSRPNELWGGSTALLCVEDEHKVDPALRGSFRDILFFGYDSTKNLS